MQKIDFYEHPAPRKNVLECLTCDLLEMNQKGDDREILLCFSCDPYQPIDDIFQLTRRAIMDLCVFKRHFTVLTKGGERSERDFDFLQTFNDLCRYGVTLVFAKDEDSLRCEPGAAPTSERIRVLERAHNLGIRTWVSLEPVWTPEDAFELIKRTHSFVDEFRIGKLNHHPHSKTVNWKQFKKDVVQLCEGIGCRYVLKNDLEVL
jgi:DNA repair photolyase